MCSTIIKDAIDNVLSNDQLRAIHAGLSTHVEDARIKLMAKQIFTRDISMSLDTKKAIDLNVKAIEQAVTVGFYRNYYTDTGFLDWTLYSSHIMQATGIHTYQKRRLLEEPS